MLRTGDENAVVICRTAFEQLFPIFIGHCGLVPITLHGGIDEMQLYVGGLLKVICIVADKYITLTIGGNVV